MVVGGESDGASGELKSKDGDPSAEGRDRFVFGNGGGSITGNNKSF